MPLGNNLFLIANLIPLQSNLAALIFPEKDVVHPRAGIEGILFLTLGGLGQRDKTSLQEAIL